MKVQTFPKFLNVILTSVLILSSAFSCKTRSSSSDTSFTNLSLIAPEICNKTGSSCPAGDPKCKRELSRFFERSSTDQTIGLLSYAMALELSLTNGGSNFNIERSLKVLNLEISADGQIQLKPGVTIAKVQEQVLEARREHARKNPEMYSKQELNKEILAIVEARNGVENDTFMKPNERGARLMALNFHAQSLSVGYSELGMHAEALALTTEAAHSLAGAARNGVFEPTTGAQVARVVAAHNEYLTAAKATAEGSAATAQELPKIRADFNAGMAAVLVEAASQGNTAIASGYSTALKTLTGGDISLAVAEALIPAVVADAAQQKMGNPNSSRPKANYRNLVVGGSSTLTGMGISLSFSPTEYESLIRSVGTLNPSLPVASQFQATGLTAVTNVFTSVTRNKIAGLPMELRPAFAGNNAAARIQAAVTSGLTRVPGPR